MDLATFVAETLSEIQKGVASAIEATKEVKGVINPVFGTADDVGREHVKEVSFDVAVTVSEKSGGSVGGGIKVVGLKIGGELSEGSESSHVSRVQFSVPLISPFVTVARKA
ncbi:MAG: hypothetical protein ABIP09_08135 [Gemmatimonadaceae bacterium]